MSRKLLLLIVLMGAGCRPVDPQQSFTPVKGSVQERLGKEVHWNTSSTEDAEVAASIKRMLSEDLSVDSAIQIALLNNRHLQSVYEDLGVAQADLVQAGMFKNPVFHGNIGFVEAGGFKSRGSSSVTSGGVQQSRESTGTKGNPAPPPIPPPSGASSSGSDSNVTAEVGMVFEFMDLFLVPMRKAIAAERLGQATAQLTSEVLDLAGEVRTTYYALQAAQQLSEMHATALSAGEASFEVARRLHAAGTLTDLALAAEEAEYQELKLDAAAAENRVAEQRERLNRLMGLWGADIQWKIQPRLAELPEGEIPLDQIERRAVARSYDLDALRRRIQAAGQSLGLSKVEGLVPEVELGVSSRYASERWITGPLFAMPVPLFDQGQGKQAAAASELRRAQQEFVAVAVDLRSEVREARYRLLASRDRVAYLQRVILPLRHRVLEETQKNYNAMLSSPLDLLRARQQEIAAGSDFVQSLLEYWLARAEVEQLLSGSRLSQRHTADLLPADRFEAHSH